MPVPLALDAAPAGQAAGWRKHEDIIDALPYVDTLSTEEKARVDELIREEVGCAGTCTSSPRTHGPFPAAAGPVCIQ